MPTAAEHALLLKKLLPEGPIWNSSDQTDGASSLDLLLNAFSIEPSRLDDAAEQLVALTIPDSLDCDLDAWERIVGTPDEDLTDAERLARIRQILYGPPDVSLPSLQTAIRLLADDEGVRLFNRPYETAAVGLCNAGDSMAVGAWEFAWLLELLPSMFAGSPDDFVGMGWSGFDALSTNNQRSPVSLLLAADTAQFPVSPLKAACDLTGTANGDEVYMSMWVKATAAVTIELGITGRDGTERSDTFALIANGWNRIATRQSVGTGGATPAAFLRSSVAAVDVYISWFVAGICNDGLVARATALFPIHTRAVIGVQGEFATLLEQDPLDVTY